MIRGRNDWPVDLETIERVDDEGDSYSIKKSDGWNLFIGKDECDGFVPQVGDWILTERPVNNIATIIIEGRVVRRKSAKVIEAEHKAFSDSFRLKKLERFVAEGDELKARAAALPKALAERMERFAKEGGREFWIDSAGYEMCALEGSAALLRKVKELDLIDNIDNINHVSNDAYLDESGLPGVAIEWLENWWLLNTKTGGYNYTKQMEMVPDFGDGHSGNTAGAAYALAIRILKGEDI